MQIPLFKAQVAIKGQRNIWKYMEGREQEWGGRMSSEQEEDFLVALPWSLFPEELRRCSESMGWWAQTPTEKSDVLSASCTFSSYLCSVGFISGSRNLLNMPKWPAWCFEGVGIIILILINTNVSCHCLTQGKGMSAPHHMGQSRWWTFFLNVQWQHAPSDHSVLRIGSVIHSSFGSAANSCMKNQPAAGRGGVEKV